MTISFLQKNSVAVYTDKPFYRPGAGAPTGLTQTLLSTCGQPVHLFCCSCCR